MSQLFSELCLIIKTQTLSNSVKADCRLAGNMINTIFVAYNSRSICCNRKWKLCAI